MTAGNGYKGPNSYLHCISRYQAYRSYAWSAEQLSLPTGYPTDRMGWMPTCYHHHWERCQVDGAIPLAQPRTCSVFDLGWRPSLFYAAGVVQWFLDSYELGESGRRQGIQWLALSYACLTTLSSKLIELIVSWERRVLLSPLPPSHLVVVYPEGRNSDMWKGLSYYCASLIAYMFVKYTKEFLLL